MVAAIGVIGQKVLSVKDYKFWWLVQCMFIADATHWWKHDKNFNEKLKVMTVEMKLCCWDFIGNRIYIHSWKKCNAENLGHPKYTLQHTIKNTFRHALRDSVAKHL